MVFRDDKDALAQRLADLEHDLKDAREGLDRKDEELQRLRARLGGLDTPPRRSRSVVVYGVLALGVAAAGAGFWLVSARREPPPLPVARTVPPPQPPIAPVVVEPPPVEPVVPTPPPAPSAELTWKASVRAARGTFAGLRAGTSCTVDVDARGGGSLDFTRVAVRCGDTVLYDSSAPVRGTMMSQTSGNLRELPAPGGGHVYQLLYQDTGTRSLEARPQLEIGTGRRIARIFHDGALGGSVELTIDKDSQAREGDPLTQEAE